MKSIRNPYSKSFSNFYDIYANEDFSKVTQLVNSLLDTHNPDGKTLLELGCGTGKILESISKRYTFEGLDISQHMLAIAKKKFPKARFYLKDMTNFSIHKKFDAIICFSDAINHLHTFSEWRKTFQRVSTHLRKGGIFIFDMNTQVRLERLSHMTRYVSPLLQNQFFTVKVSHVKDTMYSFSIQLFTMEKNAISLHEDVIMESSFPIQKVKKSLEGHFTIKDMLDVVRPKVSKKTGKVVFICKK